MESPVTADEADDSYQTLGVGRSLPSSHDTSSKFACAAEKAAWTSHAWFSEERCLRELLKNHGFTISVFVAVAITAMFAFVFEASQELVATLTILGILTAVAEYVFRLNSEHEP
jgi:hypothetical protein